MAKVIQDRLSILLTTIARGARRPELFLAGFNGHLFFFPGGFSGHLLFIS
jgi:hypothetical protein